VLDIFAYLKRYPTGGIFLDPELPWYDRSGFVDYDWTDIYGPTSEELLPKMPEPLGPVLTMLCFADADHASNLVTRHSHTGIVIFLSRGLLWCGIASVRILLRPPCSGVNLWHCALQWSSYVWYTGY
jgi:hypothetical protein